MLHRFGNLQLLAVQLNDQLFLDVLRNTFSFGIGDKCAFQFCVTPVEPVEFIILTAELAGDRSIAPCFFSHADHIARC